MQLLRLPRAVGERERRQAPYRRPERDRPIWREVDVAAVVEVRSAPGVAGNPLARRVQLQDECVVVPSSEAVGCSADRDRTVGAGDDPAGEVTAVAAEPTISKQGPHPGPNLTIRVSLIAFPWRVTSWMPPAT